jgi:diguanylate cyclase (GGDEF)-like protein/PAS domain S-box-containing protein
VSAGAPRAFRRDGFLGRTLPFLGAALIGCALLTVGPLTDLSLLLRASIGLSLIGGLAYVVPWHQLPRWTDVAPPLLMLLLFAALRRQLGPGLETVALAPLFLIPVFWVALYGTWADLAVMLGALTVARVVPTAIGGDTAELGFVGPAVLISAGVCVLTRRAVEETRRTEASLRALLDRLPVGFAVVDDSRIVYANQRIATFLGWDRAGQLLGIDAASLLHPDERPGVADRFAATLRGDAPPPSDRRLLHRDGGEVVFDVHAAPTHFEGRTAIGVVVRDVSDERLLAAAEAAAHERIAHERARMLAILSAVRDGVALLDHELRGIYANPAYLELFALDERTFVGMGRDAFVRHVATLVDDPADLEARLSNLAPTVDDQATFVFVRPRRRVLRRTIRAIALPDGPGHLVLWHDVTADHDLATERERQAMTDPLTGLANRRGGALGLEREVARARRGGAALSVALLDIDRFKQINDSLGHAAGDQVLIAVAGVLAGEARITDVMVRWGGEEFLAILPGDTAGARSFCDRVRRALLATSLGEVAAVTLSGGIAELADGEEAGSLVARADERLYAAKRGGRDRIES